MIDKVKILLDISDDNSDEKLFIYLDFACQYVKSYCGFHDIPQELENVICMLTCSLFNQSEQVNSLSLGDVSMSFSKNDAFLEYRNILNKYRKVGF